MSRSDRSVVPVQRTSSDLSLDRADIVIIGNGIAGLTAAVEARHRAPDKRIVIVTDQLHPTINTPALKQFAIAKLAREQLLAYPAGTERAERIHVVNARVEEIHAQSKYITFSGNRGFGYDSLLIATGSAPIGLPENTPGCGFDGVLTLHRLQDYLDLRRRLPEVREAVVVGGGVHAIETVMGLLYWGIRVHWLIRGNKFMGRMLDERASEMVLNNVRRTGAIVHIETEVAGIIGRVGVVAGVITNQQEMIPCQLVLTCTGTQSVLTLARQCSVPMRCENGILVDDKLRTSVRDIYAAGDVAALRNPQTGRYEPRAQWYAAVMQGRIAGAMMTGHDELARQPFGVQWHATHLGDLSMLTVGDPLLQNGKITTLTDTSQGGYRRLAVLDDRLLGYLSLGATQPDSLAIKRIIDEGHPIHDITRALLKGNIDARGHLSHQTTRAARGMLTRKLTAPLGSALPAQDTTAQTRRLPETGPFTKLPAAKQTGQIAALPAPQRTGARPEPVEAVPVASKAATGPAREAMIVFEEGISPFTGNLPAVAMSGNMSKELFPAARPVSIDANSGSMFVEELNPFNGNLPQLSGRVVEAAARTTDQYREEQKRNLWNYGQRNEPAKRPDVSRRYWQREGEV